MVINLRGTSGSGKTTVVRGLIERGTLTPLGGTPKKPEAYRLEFSPSTFINNTYIIGSYENVCGGCDSISTQDEICRRIRDYAKAGHVVVEGLLMSHLFSRYAMLDRELHALGTPFIWAFLDTPLETCIARVQQRRDARGTVTPLNTKNTTDKWHDMRRVFKKCVNGYESDWKKVKGFRVAKLDARWLNHTKAVDEVYGWLQS